MVLGAPRKGLKVTYTTDTRPTESIAVHAADSDLFICEGMYGEPEKKAKAKEYHWDTDGECMLAYIKADTDGKYHLKDRHPVYTSWDETESGNTTVCVEL